MRLSAIASLTCLGIMLAGPGANAQSSNYPNRPVTMVVGSGTGGIVDTTARFYAKILSDKIGQPVIVDNKPGAAGIVGVEAVANAKPDGYTMLYATQGPFATFPYLYKKLSFKPLESFVTVHGMVDTALLLMVNSSAPYKTLDELIDYLKKNPGKVNFGSTGVGTANHLTGELFQQATGTKMFHVPYKTSSSQYADLLSGTIDVIFDFTVAMRPQIEAGKLRALAISRDTRIKNLPDVPTFKERGLDVIVTAWSALVMPAGTPQDIVSKMSSAFAQAMRDPAALKYNEDNDFGSLGHLGPSDLRQFFISESEKFKQVVERSGVSLD